MARNDVFVDPEDKSVVRNEARLLDIFEKVGLQLVEVFPENEYPIELVPVQTFVLK